MYIMKSIKSNYSFILSHFMNIYISSIDKNYVYMTIKNPKVKDTISKPFVVCDTRIVTPSILV